MAFAISLRSIALEGMTSWDAIIIGGGPAGAAASIRLAQAGRQVLLLEKEPQAHHKVCGEFISTEAQFYLEKLGLDLRALGACSIDRVSIVHRKKITTTSLPFTALSLSRHVLDEQLLLLAVKNGVELRRGVNVGGIEPMQEGLRIRLAGSEKGEMFSTPAVFLATGKHDLRGLQRPPSIQNNLVGLKMHFRLPAGKPYKYDDVAIFLFDGGYAGLERIEDNLINLCLVISKHHLALLLHSWEQLLGELMVQTPMLAERFDGAEPCWRKPLAIYGIPYGFVYRGKPSVSGLYRLGDQMAVIPSFFGNGMSIALHSAFSAVESYLHNDEAHYHRRLARELYPKLFPAAWLSRMMVTPLMQPLLFKSCQAFPKLVKSAAINTRLAIPDNIR
jgi:menaquinone-9 beta-reductase